MKSHAPEFLKLVSDAKSRIKETNVEEVLKKKERGEKFHFVDVREDDEWRQGRAQGAMHLGKGVIERDIEVALPNKNEPIILYCGGGFRSALAAEMIQKMGYTQVLSMDGGMRAWRERGLPEDSD